MRSSSRSTLIRLAGAAVFALLLAGCHATTGGGTSGSVTIGDDDASVQVVFGDRERRLIRNYYAERFSDLPPGLAKKKRLPPGLRKQVERNGELPPGLRGEPLPRDLERRLRELPDEYVRLRAGFDVVLMNRETRVVVDIIEDIGEY